MSGNSVVFVRNDGYCDVGLIKRIYIIKCIIILLLEVLLYG
jgi:hypothetical protein